MAKIDRKSLSLEELEALRAKDREHQKAKRERLQSGKPINITLSIVTLNRLIRLCETLGYKKPIAESYGRLDTLSKGVTHVINLEYKSRSYKPLSAPAKALYRLYKVVSHLKNDLEYSDQEIIDKMIKDKENTPRDIIQGEQLCQWSEKSIYNILSRDLEKEMKKLDEFNQSEIVRKKRKS